MSLFGESSSLEAELAAVWLLCQVIYVDTLDGLAALVIVAGMAWHLYCVTRLHAGRQQLRQCSGHLINTWSSGN